MKTSRLCFETLAGETGRRVLSECQVSQWPMTSGVEWGPLSRGLSFSCLWALRGPASSGSLLFWEGETCGGHTARLTPQGARPGCCLPLPGKWLSSAPGNTGPFHLSSSIRLRKIFPQRRRRTAGAASRAFGDLHPSCILWMGVSAPGGCVRESE